MDSPSEDVEGKYGEFPLGIDSIYEEARWGGLPAGIVRAVVDKG
jgi:hypothetical protein